MARKSLMMTEDLMSPDIERHDFSSEDDDDYDESEEEDFKPDATEEDVKKELDSAASSSQSEDGEDESKTKKKTKEMGRKPVSKLKQSTNKKTREIKKGQNLKVPLRPLPAYYIWLQENREKIKEENPGLSIIEEMMKAGEIWSNIADKSAWIMKAMAAEKKYDQEMIEYNKKLKEREGSRNIKGLNCFDEC